MNQRSNKISPMIAKLVAHVAFTFFRRIEVSSGSVLGGKRMCLNLKRQIFFDMSKNDMSFLDKSFYTCQIMTCLF